MKINKIFDDIIRRDDSHILKLIAFALAYESFLRGIKGKDEEDIEKHLPAFCELHKHDFSVYLKDATNMFRARSFEYCTRVVTDESSWKFSKNVLASMLGSVIIFCLVSGITIFILGIVKPPEDIGALEYICRAIDNLVRK